MCLYICVSGMCVCAYVCVNVSIMKAYGGHKSVFEWLPQSLSTLCLRQGLSLHLELIGWPGWLVSLSNSLLPSLRILVTHCQLRVWVEGFNPASCIVNQVLHWLRHLLNLQKVHFSQLRRQNSWSLCESTILVLLDWFIWIISWKNVSLAPEWHTY